VRISTIWGSSGWKIPVMPAGVRYRPVAMVGSKYVPKPVPRK
jgi:hypothetical protein